MSATGNRDNGTTLIEALVAVAIVGLVSALLFPALTRTVSSLALGLASQSVIAQLRQARSAAILGDEAVQLQTFSRLPPGVDARFGQPLLFYPDGGSSGGHILLSAGKRRATLDVDPGTGLVSAGAS